ncbi:hypothetical protein [Shimia sp.]|uniref:hypothetical protein n=1 Tax=Shimia sp. TaxID=1954381 RepID=UPI003297B2E2
MTVICLNHREEIEGAIRHCDDDLIIYENFDPNDYDCGPFALWHPDWEDDECEKTFSKEIALSYGLDSCLFIEHEEVGIWIDDYLFKLGIRDHVAGFIDDDGAKRLFSGLTERLLKYGYVTFAEFAMAFLGSIQRAMSISDQNVQRAKVSLQLARQEVKRCYLEAVLNEDVSDLTVRLMEAPSIVRLATLPEIDEILAGLPVPPPIGVVFR